MQWQIVSWAVLFTVRQLLESPPVTGRSCLSANPRTAISYSNRHTSAVADANARAKCQRAMRRCHLRTIQTLPARCGTAADPIT